MSSLSQPRGIRWWPLGFVALATAIAVGVVRTDPARSYQQRNLATLTIAACTLGAVLLWWLFASRTSIRRKLTGLGCTLLLAGAGAGLFRIRGVSGDLVPIMEPRWNQWLASSSAAAPKLTGAAPLIPAESAVGISKLVQDAASEYPQFLGARRDGVLPAPARAWGTNWSVRPPEVVWRHAIGPAWSGFAVAGGMAWTQEQSGPQEKVTCYELSTGRLIWEHADEARYATTLAGEGPRATPTVSGFRVITLGATGWLNCLDRATGKKIWSHNLVSEVPAGTPGWGFSGSPLVHQGMVIVIAGGNDGRSVVAYDLESGALRWSGGTHGASYSSPVMATLAGVPQILAFNSSHLTSHDPATGAVLWDHPFGNEQPHVAVPILIGTNQVLISAGYGMGSQLVEVSSPSVGKLVPSALWHSRKLKAKFSTPFVRDGFAYGLDDGMFACVELKDGAQRWKEGRFGHGQGLLVGNHYLLMAEIGELVLLNPSPEGLGMLGKFRVFSDKTWNPIAVVGNLVLVRNDQEAALVRIPESN